MKRFAIIILEKHKLFTDFNSKVSSLSISRTCGLRFALVEALFLLAPQTLPISSSVLPYFLSSHLKRSFIDLSECNVEITQFDSLSETEFLMHDCQIDYPRDSMRLNNCETLLRRSWLPFSD